MHECKEITLEDLIMILWIEEYNRVFDKKLGKLPIEFKENLESKINKKRRYFGEGLTKRKDKSKNIIKGAMCVINKAKGLKIATLKYMIRKKQKYVIEEEKLESNVSNSILSTMVFESNMEDKPKEWWMDRATTHCVYSNRKMFSPCVQRNGKLLYMGNLVTSKVKRHRKCMYWY